MITSHEKEKAYNAIAFFLENTSMCNKKKLYKLLWLFDSEHYEQTGRSVTGYDYEAWQMGPVPLKLHQAIQRRDPDLLENFEVPITKGKKDPVLLRNKNPFDGRYFSKRQRRILSSLEDRFSLATGDEMEAWTHRSGTPWHRVWMVENRKNVVIPYDYALDHLPPEQQEAIRRIAEDRKAFLSAY
ncbi:MAG TPA: Panacea domain-containing protein [Pyrinomonadaceae bacterium]|nr:Panacea domain-containing protein [Pyrinomonadaceae bacterium]